MSVPRIDISPHRRREIVDALRRGTVPSSGLDLLAVGIDHLERALDEDLDAVASGGGSFKAIRGEYGSGKTFTVRWLAERARSRGFATSEVQISETETPLHRLETVYRRVVERLSTPEQHGGALRTVIDAWFFALEDDAIAQGGIDSADETALLARTNELMEARLREVSKSAPAFAAALRGYRAALAAGDEATAEALIAWVSGQPNVAAAAKREAGIKGGIDHFGALSFLQGLLVILRDSGHAGLVIVLDEVETLQRVRSDVREKSLNALRQLIDEVDSGRFPGLMLVLTGTPAFFDGPQGIQRLAPLAQRLHVDWPSDERFDNPRAPQVRLRGFTDESLETVGRKVRDIYASGQPTSIRISSKVDDACIQALAHNISGELGGKVGIAPRLFLKKLIAGVLDPVDLHEDFHPARDFALTVVDDELTDLERNARAGRADDIELDLGDDDA